MYNWCMSMQSYKDVDEYIALAPEAAKTALVQIRKLIKSVAPNADEKISYGIPTYRIGKRVIHFGGYDKHVSIYPGATGVSAFSERLKDYDTSKGTVRFYLDKPIPYDLIKEIALFCVGPEQ